jgi:hypothetical protein
MKRLVILSVITAMMINLESMSATLPTTAGVQTKRVIKNAQDRGAKVKLRLKSTLVILPPSPEEVVVDDDIVLGRNRNRLDIVDEKEEELSDYIKIRLMLARMKAMRAYSIASLSK